MWNVCLRNLNLLGIFEISLAQGIDEWFQKYRFFFAFEKSYNHSYADCRCTHFLNFASFGFLADSVG